MADLIKDHNPWRGFHDEGPLLTVVRAQTVPLGGQGGGDCSAWVNSLVTDTVGKDIGGATTPEWGSAVAEWGPWKKEEIEGITSCTRMPCDVKLNEAETAQMAASEKSVRLAKFTDLALERVHRYQKTQERKEYEFAGDPMDPWKYFETLGLKSLLAMPAKQQLELRRVDFFPGRVKTLHQVFDTRISVASDRREATLWRRDAYSDHYFDGWGEWADVSCAAGTVTVVQAVMLELDLNLAPHALQDARSGRGQRRDLPHALVRALEETRSPGVGRYAGQVRRFL